MLERTKPTARENLGKIFLSAEEDEEKYSRVKTEMLSNIDWPLLFQEYLRFKADTKEFSELGSSLSSLTSAMQSFNPAKRRKREVAAMEGNKSDIDRLVDFVQTEQFLNMSSQYGEMMVEVGEDLENIMVEVEILNSQLDGHLDLGTLLTLAVTSPRVSAIISSLVNILEQLEVAFIDSPYLQSFLTVKESLVILDEFVKSTTKNIEISAILLNWNQLTILMEEIEAFSPSEISEMGSTVLSTQGIFLMMAALEEFECDWEVMARYLEFYEEEAPLNTTRQALASSVCNFITSNNWQNILTVLDIPSAFHFFASVFRLSPMNLAATANLTTSELYDTMANLEAAAALFPSIEESLASLVDELNITEFNSSTISPLFCGTNITDIEINYKVNFQPPGQAGANLSLQPLQPAASNGSSGDDEHSTLQDGCDIIKEELDSSWAGHIVWTFLDKMLRYSRSDILYTTLQ